MAKHRTKGPYVGHSILILDDKHRISLSSKLADKIKIRSKKKYLYLYACFQDGSDQLRLLKLYDEEFYQQNDDDVHAGVLEETQLQANNRLQIPNHFYHFLGFNRDHRYVFIIADRTGNYYHLYNLAMLARNLPDHEEFGEILPNLITISSYSDKRLKKYLSQLAVTPSGSHRQGYKWLAQRLAGGPQQDGLDGFQGNGNFQPKKDPGFPFSPPSFLPDFEENGESHPPDFPPDFPQN